MATKTVGEFTMDLETYSVTGPAEFMASEDYAEWASRLDNPPEWWLHSLRLSPNIETGILVSLQTVYAGWHGRETFLRAHGLA